MLTFSRYFKLKFVSVELLFYPVSYKIKQFFFQNNASDIFH